MNTVKTKLVFLALLTMLFGIYACAHTASRAMQHPVELTTAPLCSDCHQDWRSAMDHTERLLEAASVLRASSRPRPVRPATKSPSAQTATRIRKN